MYKQLVANGLIDRLEHVYRCHKKLGKEAAIEECSKSLTRPLCEAVVELVRQQYFNN